MLKLCSLSLILLVACNGDKGDTNEEEGEPGGPCADGSACISDEFCLITGGATEGTCTPIPGACAEDPCDCDEIYSECVFDTGDTGGTYQSCFAFGSAVTVECS